MSSSSEGWPHQGVFAFWGFKLSDLVNTFDEIVGILFTLRPEGAKRPSGGEGRGWEVGGGIPLPHQGVFAFFGIQSR